MFTFIITLVLISIIIAITFGFTSLIAYIICWCLGITFTPKITIIAYLIWLLLRRGPIIKITNNAKDKDKFK
jgi:hypothetical protein